jgi:hypothetical protein
MIAYGTGGTVDSDYEGLKDLFYEPDVYNALEIKNVWDEGYHKKKCGFFVPMYYNVDGADEDGNLFMDDYGNSFIRVAIKWALKERDRVGEASDRLSIDRHVAEHPFTPEEATLQVSGNIFPKKELLRHLSDIRNDERLLGFKQVGDLFFSKEGKIEWVPSKKPMDLTTYKLGAKDDPAGQIVIWEHPADDPPHGLYIMGCDPYDHDSSNTDSLGSAIVYKRFQSFEEYYDLPVAEYTGRPQTAEMFYEEVRKLALYYKARILYENEKKGIHTYFVNKHCDYLLAEQPNSIKDIIRHSTVDRVKGIHMPKEIKSHGERLIYSWLIEEYAPGKKNLTKIFSEPLLEELISFNFKGNFDRVMAFMLVMIYREELYNMTVKEASVKSKAKLFEQPLFMYNIE